MCQILGIDIGGTGMKAAIVDVVSGQMLTEKHRVLTPKPATPNAVGKVFLEILDFFSWSGSIGCGFPAIIQNGVARTAANVEDAWIGVNIETFFGDLCGHSVVTLNDADAAGMAEMAYGAGKGFLGTTLMLTIGTGIGTALFHEGKLFPNSELGHLYLPNGIKAEHHASNLVRKEEELTWEQWARKFQYVLDTYERLFAPELIILGGGGSKKFDKYKHIFQTSARIVSATFKNDAGVIGAAVAAKHLELV